MILCLGLLGFFGFVFFFFCGGWGKRCVFTYSVAQNELENGVGWDLSRSSGSTLLPKQDHLELVALDPVQMVF